MLLNPPRSEKLTRLTACQLHALKALNLGPTTVSELSSDADEVDTLISQLAAGGWLTVAVRDGAEDLYDIVPCGQPPPRPAPSSHSSIVLSKFAVLHRDSESFVLEHPLSWCDVRIHDARLLPLLDGSESTNLPSAVASQFIEDLRWSGMLVAAGDEDQRFEALSWSAPDLWFHRRSTLGERNVTWEHFGPTEVGQGPVPRSHRRAQRNIRASRSHCPSPTWRTNGYRTRR